MAFNVSVKDSSPLIHYYPPGDWEGASLGNLGTYADLNSFHSTWIHGASLSFSFNGTGVWLYSALIPNRGTYTISIDGQLISNQDSDSSLPESQRLLGSATGLNVGFHEVNLTFTGSGSTALDLDHLVFETFTELSGSAVSIAPLDDHPSISYSGSQWMTDDYPTFFNDTVHYAQGSDASVQFSFDGDAIAVYGTVAPSIGTYTVVLDGVEHFFDGWSDIVHPQTLLYLATGIGVKPHNLTITSNPSQSGQSPFFEHAISVFAISQNTGDDNYTALSSTSGSTTLMTPSSSSSSVPIMYSTSVPYLHDISARQSSIATYVGQHSSRGNVGASTYTTNKGLLAAIASSAVIALLAMAFLILFCWKRHRSDPPRYHNTLRSPSSPDLPIQDVEKSAGFYGNEGLSAYSQEQPSPDAPSPHNTLHSNYASSQCTQSHMSNRSSMSRYSTDFPSTYSESFAVAPGYKGHVRMNSQSSVTSYSSRSTHLSFASTSQLSDRILINDIPMPPQFMTPQIPAPSVPPLRPARPRDTFALPF